MSGFDAARAELRVASCRCRVALRCGVAELGVAELGVAELAWRRVGVAAVGLCFIAAVASCGATGFVADALGGLLL